MRSFLVLLVIPLVVFAQDIIPVEVKHYGDDTYGEKLAYYLRTEIVNNPRYKGEYIKTPRWCIHLVTLDPDRGDYQPYGQIHTIYSAAYTSLVNEPLEIFLTSFVGIAGSERLKETAENLLVNLDTIIGDMVEGQGDSTKE